MFERLWLFHCGYIDVPRTLVLEGGGFERIPLPFMAALAEHAEYGPVLFDAPFGRQGPTSLGRAVAGTLDMLGLEFRSEWAVVPRIESLGFRPAEVEHVFMTHLHFDHTGGMSSLGEATFHVSDDEWAHAGSFGTLRATVEGYAPDDYRPLEERVEPFEAPDPLSEDREAGRELFDDGSLRALDLPGHTPGHVGYELQFENGETVLHVGDAAFAISQITEGDELGLQARTFASDVPTTQRSLEALRRYADDHPDTTLFNAHDPVLAERCREEPIALID